jgi:hypothetical protein
VFVVTKTDLAPEHVLKHTLQGLTALLKKSGVRKRPFLVGGPGGGGGFGTRGGEGVH